MKVENCPLCGANGIWDIRDCREYDFHHPRSSTLGRRSSPDRDAFDRETVRIIREVDDTEHDRKISESITRATTVIGVPRPADHARSVEGKKIASD